MDAWLLALLLAAGVADAVMPFFGSVTFIPAIKAIIPTGTPIVGSNVGMAFPFEVTIPDPGMFMSRMRNAEPGQDRWMLYRGVAWFLDRLGVDGEACVKRSLCEVASAPRTPGLVGDVVHALFTIPRGQANSTQLSSYYRASKQGRTLGQCDLAYAGCPMSLHELPDLANVRWL
ncbi:uncharacterized protein LOC121836097 [Ixodes scapularis]|uniref:uncharacterized protein LOC121836097 n=1 Tax=Ixodes scapularis TaxID=6945 RepID=UPI001C38B0FB|nr:uncharacterized protein LOC121836097 [Ixodes scapularis]